MRREKLRRYDDKYWKLIDALVAPYTAYAKKHGLTENEMFVLSVIWNAEDGCMQSEICERLSYTKQAVSATVKKFQRMGWLSLTGSEEDRRSKIVRLTPAGEDFAKEVIPPALEAQVSAMAELEERDILELLRITAILSRNIQKNFASLSGEKKEISV